MKNKNHLFFLLLVVIVSVFCIGGVKAVSARENVDDWYIQNFDSEITVNQDSSLDITEKITADCGNCVGKHGIFRILPEDVKIGEKTIPTPVELVSVTDLTGRKINYTQTRNSQDETITWKIGDPDVTVQGINYYKIVYRVKNAIRFDSAQFDELYWNLTGNFWDLEIDNFHGSLIFPAEVSEKSSTVDYYTGSLGDKGQYLATYRWTAPSVLELNSTGTLGLRQGITASITFPKNIFVPYQPTAWEKYGKYLTLPIPLIVFCICFWLWRKYGKDPRVDKTVIAEYDAPGKLSPIEMGMLMANGKFDNKLITAEIINLATKKLLTIKEVDEKILFFKSRDYELTKTSNAETKNLLNAPQRSILDKIFAGAGTVKLSALKNEFYKEVKDIEKKTRDVLDEKKLIVPTGLVLGRVFMIVGAILIGSTFMLGSFGGIFIASTFLSGLIIFIFSFFMPKRTPAGAELNWQIKGFKLFMETVDKYRAEFYEKENIFEKFLPYAIVFGITGIWIKKMKEIYGEDYYAHYAPVWYAGNVAAFDADSFASTIDNLSSDIAANTSAPSGSGGGGGAGGGGGGGGGGGW